jgi:hypothetical protein
MWVAASPAILSSGRLRDGARKHQTYSGRPPLPAAMETAVLARRTGTGCTPEGPHWDPLTTASLWSKRVTSRGARNHGDARPPGSQLGRASAAVRP